MWHIVVTNFSKVSFVQIEGLLKRSINNYNKYEYEKNNLICRIDTLCLLHVRTKRRLCKVG